MADNRTQRQRSYNMSRIHSSDTSPEMVVRKYLYAHGLRYRIHVKHLAGKPDIVFTKKKKVVFINGCFWHRHTKCKYAKTPSSNLHFWQSKFENNVKRDKKNLKDLENEGWMVKVVWECQLLKESQDKTLKMLLKWLLEN